MCTCWHSVFIFLITFILQWTIFEPSIHICDWECKAILKGSAGSSGKQMLKWNWKCTGLLGETAVREETGMDAGLGKENLQSIMETWRLGMETGRKQDWARRSSDHDAHMTKTQPTRQKAPEERLPIRGVLGPSSQIMLHHKWRWLPRKSVPLLRGQGRSRRCEQLEAVS